MWCPPGAVTGFGHAVEEESHPPLFLFQEWNWRQFGHFCLVVGDILGPVTHYTSDIGNTSCLGLPSLVRVGWVGFRRWVAWIFASESGSGVDASAGANGEPGD
jgi:hypothetical protein